MPWTMVGNQHPLQKSYLLLRRCSHHGNQFDNPNHRLLVLDATSMPAAIANARARISGLNVVAAIASAAFRNLRSPDAVHPLTQDLSCA